MTSVKAIVCDLDGTLLVPISDTSRKRKLAPKMLEKIQELRGQGIGFTIATGRSFQSIQVIEDLPSFKDEPIISMNGGIIVKGLTGEIIKEYVLDEKIFKNVTKIVRDAGKCSLHAFIKKGLAHDSVTGSNIPIEEDGMGDNRMEVDFYKDLTQDDKVYKFMMTNHNEPQYLHSLKDELVKALGDSCSVVFSAHTTLEICPKEATKGNALKYVKEHFNIENNNIMTFGDSENDESMLKQAGVGVVMENGFAHLKEDPNLYNTGRNTEHGVLNFINSWFHMKS